MCREFVAIVKGASAENLLARRCLKEITVLRYCPARELRGELNAREELLSCEADCMKTESLRGNLNAGEELLPWRAVRLKRPISAVREEPLVAC